MERRETDRKMERRKKNSERKIRNMKIIKEMI